jgi:hypothetical protein
MVQGSTITIPLTSTTGFQHTAHVIVHMENSEPDLGRKGFQPDQTRLAEQLAVAAVNALKRYYHQMLKKPGASREFGEEKALDDWIRKQEEHEKNAPIIIKGDYLFCPTEKLPIKSEPIVEQDVVALFNQMLSSGIVRGIQLISSSQYKQYDGLFRLYMDEPFDRYILSETNPLGLNEEVLAAGKTYESKVKVIEYKYSVNGLIEELQTEMKNANDISIIVAWEMGEKWKNLFEVVSFLIPDNVHHRTIHGTTHQFIHSGSGTVAFSAIILKDLIAYLCDRENEVGRQKDIYSTDDF